MRKLMPVIIILLIFLGGCASVRYEMKDAPQTSSTKFIPMNEVAQEFIMLSNAKEMEDQLTDEGKERLKTLQPDDAFITPEHLAELHRTIVDNNKNKGEKSTYQEKESGVDRRNCDTRVVNQCGGTCTSHGVSNAMDNLLCKPNAIDASNMDLWSKYKQYSQWSAIRAANAHTICEERDFPNCGKKSASCDSNSHIRLKSYDYIGNDITKAKSYLDQGIPLVYAGKVTTSWANCDRIINPNSSTKSGGHSVAVVGYQEVNEMIGGGYFIIKNSWGSRCGDNGYQYLPFHYLQRTDGGMYGFLHAIKGVETKYSDPNSVPDKPPLICKKVRTCTKRFWGFLWCTNWTPWEVVCTEDNGSAN